MKYHEKLYASIQDLPPEQIKQALQEHVKLERMIRVQAGDFAGAQTD